MYGHRQTESNPTDGARQTAPKSKGWFHLMENQPYGSLKRPNVQARKPCFGKAKVDEAKYLLR